MCQALEYSIHYENIIFKYVSFHSKLAFQRNRNISFNLMLRSAWFHHVSIFSSTVLVELTILFSETDVICVNKLFFILCFILQSLIKNNSITINGQASLLSGFKADKTRFHKHTISCHLWRCTRFSKITFLKYAHWSFRVSTWATLTHDLTRK